MSSERTIPQHIITEHRSDGSMGRKYEPLKLIGQGGSAIAFSAKVLDINGNPTGEICLLKEFFPSKNAARNDDDSIRVLLTDSNKALKKQFLYEVSAGYAASEHIYGTTTALSSFESEKKNTYILMPYEKHGMSLGFFCDWLRKNGKTVPVRAWARLFYKLSDRVRNLHEKAEMLHSDISIGNVMIMQSDDPNELYDYVCDDKADYTVIILDFGCAYFKNDEDSEGDEDSKADENNVYAYNGRDILTAKKRDVVFTTKEFASPELLKDTHQEITSYSDIYSVVACFKYCINAVASGDKYIFSADIPATAKAQVNKILGILNADESEYIYKARVLMEMFDELIRRIDGKGVSKAILWETGNKDIAAFKRSADFDIVERILPSGRKCAQQTEYAHLDGGESKKLEDLITETKGSTYLIGEGGIGKTTSLIHYADGIYQKGYTEESVVPVYIELGNCTMDNAGLSSKLIHRYILSRMTGATLAAVSDEQISELSKLFSAEKSQPEYILMLDGLNEVSDRKSHTTDGSANRPIVTLLIYEITELIQNCKNVRVILTSRNDNESLSDSSFQRIYITGLKDEEVNRYLDEANICDEKRRAAKNNPALMEILRIPLFLSIYTRIADSIDATELSTRGELLKAFFNEKREDIYSEINRVDKLHNLPLTGEQYAFILSYVLPQICWEMVQKRTMELDSETIYDLIYKAVSDDHPMYIGFGVRSSIRRMAESLKQVEDEATKSDSLADPILNAIKDTLSVFYKKSEDEVTQTEILRIRHQHFRDYFAALYFIGLMKSARSSMARRKDNTDEAFEIMQEIRDEVIMPDVLVFVGEILGEHKNAPVLVDGEWTYNVPTMNKPQDRNLLKRTLDVFRRRFDGSVGYGVYNLYEVFTSTRGNLCGEDLSKLDLRKCNLNGVILGERKCKVLLDESFLFSHNIFSFFGEEECFSFSKNTKYIVSTSNDNIIRIWDAATYSLIRTIEGHTKCVNSALYTEDGKYIISASDDNTIKIWNASTFSLIKTLVVNSKSVKYAAYSPDKKYIICSLSDSTLIIWDATTFAPIKSLKGDSDDIRSTIYSFDGKFIISIYCDETIIIWDANSYVKKKEIHLVEGDIFCVSCAHKNDFIAVAYRKYDYEICKISIIDTRTFNFINTFSHINENGYEEKVVCMAFSLDGKLLKCFSSNGRLTVWDTSTFTLLSSFEERELDATIDFASFSYDSNYIIYKFVDYISNTIIVKTRSTSDSLFALIKQHSSCYDKCLCAAYSSNNNFIMNGSLDRTIKVWKLSDLTLFSVLEGHSYIYSVSNSPNGKTIICAYSDGTINIWNAYTFEIIKKLEGHYDTVTSISYSWDGKYIISSSRDRTIKIWDSSTYSLVKTLCGHLDAVIQAIFCPNGKYIVSISDDKTIKVWDTSSFEVIKTIDGNLDPANNVSISPDSQYIVCAFGNDDGYEDCIKIWDIDSFSVIKKIEGHDWNVNSAMYSYDGKYIISGSDDKTIKIWDSSTFDLVKTLHHNLCTVKSAVFSPDNNQIAAVMGDGTLKTWDANTYQCIATIPNIPGLRVIGVDMRNLHPDSHFSEEDKKILKQYGAIID